MTAPAPEMWVRHTIGGGWHRFDLFAVYHDDQSSLRGTWSATTGPEVDAMLAAFRGSGFRVTRVGWNPSDRYEENTPGAQHATGPAPAARRTRASGRFEVYEDSSGRHRFRLKASNGQVVATGAAYETRVSALAGVESVREAADGATIEDVGVAVESAPVGG